MVCHILHWWQQVTTVNVKVMCSNSYCIDCSLYFPNESQEVDAILMFAIRVFGELLLVNKIGQGNG